MALFVTVRSGPMRRAAARRCDPTRKTGTSELHRPDADVALLVSLSSLPLPCLGEPISQAIRVRGPPANRLPPSQVQLSPPPAHRNASGLIRSVPHGPNFPVTCVPSRRADRGHGPCFWARSSVASHKVVHALVILAAESQPPAAYRASANRS